MEVVNNKDGVPLEHYTSLFHALTVKEIAERAAYDTEKHVFRVGLMGNEYEVEHPTGRVTLVQGATPNPAPLSAQENILLLRYLCEGRVTHPATEPAFLAFQDVPSGSLYYRPFQGRCLLRAARTFGTRLGALRAVMEKAQNLHAKDVKAGRDGVAGFAFDFLVAAETLRMQIIIYEGDDEFPAQAQMLFSDTLAHCFTAEDLAEVGEIAIKRLSGYGK
jgi:hypothetical protein